MLVHGQPLVNVVHVLFTKSIAQVLLGDRAVLQCLYDLEGEELYSVKWYKQGQEFFR